MAIAYPNGVTIINIMKDGTECDDLSTYLKSPDQLPELTKRQAARFIRRGMEILDKKGDKCAAYTSSI